MKTSLHSNDLDGVMKGYFQAQMPKAWPKSPIPMEVMSRYSARESTRGRLTLAASVAALLGLGFFLSYGPSTTTGNQSDGLLKDATAKGKIPMPDMTPMTQP